MIESPIFIVGCDRSGTTLLRLMLSQNSTLHIPQESKFFPDLHKQQDLYGDFTQPYQRWFFIRDLQTNKATSKTFTFPVFKLTLQEAETALADAAPTDFPGAISALFRASAAKVNKRRWGDKTPYHVRYIPALAEAFPDAQFIHMLRNGRDVAFSIRKAGWVTSMIEAADYWQERVKLGKPGGKLLDRERYREVYYEQLVMEPEETLRDLCTWLDLEYTPQMLEYYREGKASIPKEHSELFDLIDQPVDSSRAYAWKRSRDHQEIADFESHAGELLKELGYELS